MKRTIAALGACLGLLMAAESAAADPSQDALNKCIMDSSTGKDRLILVKWIFVAMSAHPDVRTMSKVTPAERDQYNADAARTMERLVMVDCRDQAADAVRHNGEGAVGKSFEGLGQIAMVDLMSNPDVEAVMSGMASHTDREKWAAFMKAAGAKN